jgi:hypothetical protein
VLYAGNRKPYPGGPVPASREVAELEAEFEL